MADEFQQISCHFQREHAIFKAIVACVFTFSFQEQCNNIKINVFDNSAIHHISQLPDV